MRTTCRCIPTISLHVKACIHCITRLRDTSVTGLASPRPSYWPRASTHICTFTHKIYLHAFVLFGSTNNVAIVIMWRDAAKRPSPRSLHRWSPQL